MKSALLLLLAMFLVAGCSKSDVSGDIFIIKGDGSVAPSAGTTVRFIPVESEVALFEKIKAEAISKVQLELGHIVVGQCSTVTDAATEYLETLNTELSAIDFPSEGCDDLIDETSRLKTETRLDRIQYESKANKLNHGIQLAKKILDKKTAKLANRQQQAESEKVVLEVKDSYASLGSSSFGRPYFVRLTNNSTNFCLTNDSLSISLYAKSMLINTIDVSLQDLYHAERKEGACHLDAEESVEYIISYDKIAATTPQFKKAISDGIMEERACAERWPSSSIIQCAKITSITTNTTFQFADLQKSATGSDVLYKSVAVDWHEEARNSGKLKSEQKALKEAEAKLKAAKNEFSSAPSVIAFNEALVASEACQESSNRLAWLAKETASVSDNLTRTSDCSAPFHQLTSTLSNMNTAFQLGVDLPAGKAEFMSAFHAGVTEAIHDAEFKVDTSIQGSYSIVDIPKGNYLIFAEYHDNFVSGFWLESVTITKSKQKIDMNANSFVNVRFSDYLDQFSSACEKCLSNNFDFPSRAEAVSAAK